jgi:hypothetical protein
VFDDTGTPESGVTVSLALYALPKNAPSGLTLSTQVISHSSDNSGVVSFVNLLPGATYMIRRGYNKVWSPQPDATYALNPKLASEWSKFTIPANQVAPYSIPSFFGEDDIGTGL